MHDVNLAKMAHFESVVPGQVDVNEQKSSTLQEHGRIKQLQQQQQYTQQNTNLLKHIKNMLYNTTL